MVRRYRNRGGNWRMVVKRLSGIILLFCCLVFAGCASFSSLLGAQFGALPSWISNPETRIGQHAFVGKGSDENAFNAKLGALNDILSQLSTVVGEDVSGIYYRELSTTNAIKDFDLSIVREYRSESDTYLMAECSTKRLEAHRTDVENARIEEDAHIASILHDADTAYRENRDVEAVRFCLDALYEASTKKSSYVPEELYRRSLKYLEALRFTLVKGDATSATCTVRLNRKQWLFSPKVNGAGVYAVFTCINAKGERYLDYLPCDTGDTGLFTFTPSNNGMLSEGEIRFTIDIREPLERLKGVLDDNEWNQLQAIVMGNVLSFSYQMVSPYKGQSIILNAKQYSLDGKLQDSSAAFTAMTDYLGTKGLTVASDKDETQNSTELAEIIHEHHPTARYLLYGSFGVADKAVLSEGTVIVVSGQAQLWNLQTLKTVGNTEEVKAVGKTEEEAFSNLYDAVLSLLPEFI